MALSNWLIGEDVAAREHLVHLGAPRFVCRLASEWAGDAYDPSGATLRIDDDLTACEFRWIDKPLGEQDLLSLIPEIRAFLDAVEMADHQHMSKLRDLDE